MGSEVTRVCATHGEWYCDVDHIEGSRCPYCEEEGSPDPSAARIAVLEEALRLAEPVVASWAGVRRFDGATQEAAKLARYQVIRAALKK